MHQLNLIISAKDNLTLSTGLKPTPDWIKINSFSLLEKTAFSLLDKTAYHWQIETALLWQLHKTVLGYKKCFVYTLSQSEEGI